MLTYKVIARDPATGKKVKSEVQAYDEMAAAKVALKTGLIPIDINPIKPDSESTVGRFKNRIAAKDRILFSRQLSTLINAGLPLVQSLYSVIDQSSSKTLKTIGNAIIADVEEGHTLSASLAKYPRVFNHMYVNLVQAGEASGTLDKSLELLAIQQEKDAEIVRKVKSALVIPIIVLIVLLGVLVKVLPRVEMLNAGSQGVKLPTLTLILLDISHAISNYWWAFAVLVGLGGYFMGRWARGESGKRVIDGLKLHSWLLGPLYMRIYMARFARTATTLISSGVQLINVLEITSKVINNVHIAQTLSLARDKVRGGKPLSEALKDDKNFLPLVASMLKIGEQSGSMEKMLEKTAQYYEKEVDEQVKRISAIIEPALMVFLGLIAFIIVAALLFPLYGLTGKTIIQ